MPILMNYKIAITGRFFSMAGSDAEFKKTLLQAGSAAGQKLYQSLLLRIKNGETLKRSEYKLLKDLERELEPPGPESAEARIRTFGAAAAYLGLSERTITYHLRRGNLRQNADGSFDRLVLDEFLNSVGRRKVNKECTRRRMAADLRYRLARAEKEETLVAQLKEQLFSMEEIREGWQWRVTEVSAALQSLVDRLPPLLEGHGRLEMAEIIGNEIHHIRERFYRDGQFTPNEDESPA